jgi:hypothetical protein
MPVSFVTFTPTNQSIEVLSLGAKGDMRTIACAVAPMPAAAVLMQPQTESTAPIQQWLISGAAPRRSSTCRPDRDITSFTQA